MVDIDPQDINKQCIALSLRLYFPPKYLTLFSKLFSFGVCRERNRGKTTATKETSGLAGSLCNPLQTRHSSILFVFSEIMLRDVDRDVKRFTPSFVRDV